MAKILVIDDEPGIRDLLDTLLSGKGHDVILADTGEKGLEVFRRARPDVVVLDLKCRGWMASRSCNRSAVTIPSNRSSF
jgi:DNA-binding response OmpR family regulator